MNEFSLTTQMEETTTTVATTKSISTWSKFDIITEIHQRTGRPSINTHTHGWKSKKRNWGMNSKRRICVWKQRNVLSNDATTFLLFSFILFSHSTYQLFFFGQTELSVRELWAFFKISFWVNKGKLVDDVCLDTHALCTASKNRLEGEKSYFSDLDFNATFLHHLRLKLILNSLLLVC